MNEKINTIANHSELSSEDELDVKSVVETNSIGGQESENAQNIETEEQIDKQIEIESLKLLESAEELKKEINKIGSEDDFNRALENSGDRKNRIFNNHYILKMFLGMQAAALAGNVAREQIPELFESLNLPGGAIENFNIQTMVIMSITATCLIVKQWRDKKNFKKV